MSTELKALAPSRVRAHPLCSQQARGCRRALIATDRGRQSVLNESFSWFAGFGESDETRAGGAVRMQVTECAPRACGDGPEGAGPRLSALLCSPRVRGWSPAGRGCGPRQSVLPAQAGMAPGWRSRSTAVTCAPRACGDGPCPVPGSTTPDPCSPRVRGWSRLAVGPQSGAEVLPAHAGMVPTAASTTDTTKSAPRARGDSPQGFGTRRINAMCPRARGDGPRESGIQACWGWCSPRVWGLSPPAPADRRPQPVLPAPAGMVPRS